MSRHKVHDDYKHKANFIAEELRSQILDGVYGPGDNLPSRNKLVIQYNVSKVTVQRAFQKLMDDGFASVKKGIGTIVSLDSPHLTKYALLFPDRENAALGGNQLWKALANESQNINQDCQVELHFGFDGRIGVERYQSLINDVENRRLAGLMFASHPYLLVNTPLLDQPGIPRTALMTPQAGFDIPAVHFDSVSLKRKIVREVVQQKRKKIALIFPANAGADYVKEVEDEFTRAGIFINPNWIHGLSQEHPRWGMSLVSLMMSVTAGKRPDCLIVLDDNLLPAVSQGLKDLNLIPPRDLQLISHCNFPWPTQSAVPVTRIGYCITECLQAMMKQINDQKEGWVAQKEIKLPAYYEHEYTHDIHIPK